MTATPTPSLREPFITITDHLARMLRQGTISYAEYLDAETYWLNLLWKSL